jgi:hypothetical protein
MVAHGAAPGTRSPAIRAKFESFFNEWPQAKQRVPYALMQEARITPDLPGYAEFVDSLIFELMDGKLTTTEELKAFLEPFSPPAPPPPVHLRRPRAAKKDAKGKGRSKKAAAEEPAEGSADNAEAAEGDGVGESPVEAAEPVIAPALKAIAPAAKVEIAQAVEAPVRKASAAPEPVAPVRAATQPAAKKAGNGTRTATAVKRPPVKAAPSVKKTVPAKKVATAGKTATKPAAKTVVKVPAKKVAAKVAVKKVAVKKAPAKAVKKAPVKVAAKAAAKKSTATAPR